MKNRKLLIGLALVSFSFGTRLGMRYTYLGPLANLYTNSAFLITVILSLGAFLSIFLSPFFGKRSDRTWTKFGRRKPYLMVSVPLVSLFTILIPHSSSYTILIVLVIFEAIAGLIGFSPLFSLIPDNFKAEERGKVNAMFILFIGLGGACAAALGYKLWDINYHLLFYVASAITLVFGVLSFFFIKERPFVDDSLSSKSHSFKAYLKEVLGDKRITLYYCGDFFRWFCKNVIIQMVTLFAANELGVSIGLAGQVLLVFNLVKLASALPIGIITDKIDRKLFLQGGTVLMGGALYYGWCSQSFLPLMIAMGLFGISTTITIVCGSSLLMDMFPKSRSGEFLGMNMVFGSIPAVLSLWISGALIDLFGTYRLIFLIGIITCIISFIFTIFIPKTRTPS